MSTRTSPSIVVVIPLILWLNGSGPASAEGSWIHCSPTPTTVEHSSSSDSSTPSAKLEVKDLLPSPSELMGRALKFKLELLDQEDFYIEEVTLPSGRGGEERDAMVFRPNPDRYLWKTTLSLDFSKLFPSAAELKAGYEGVAAHSKWIDRSADPLSLERANGELVEYFAHARPTDRWKRFLSGISAFVAIADRPALQDGAPLPRPVLEEDDYDETYGVKVDPAKWFVDVSDWAAAYSATLAYAKAYEKPEVLRFEHPCSEQIDRRCLDGLTSLAGPRQILAAVLPVFEVKSVDQFDFVQAGKRFISTSLQDSTLETYTLTWDLGRVVSAAEDRRAALKTLAAIEKMRDPSPLSIHWSARRTIPAAPGELLYLQFESKGGLAPHVWKVSARGCGSEKSSQVFPETAFSKSGLLAGYPAAVPAGCRFTVSVRDSVGQRSHLTCEVTQR